MGKLVIDRAKWYRGQRDGSMLLRKEDGKMCCLGFEALRRGFTPDQIEDVGTPEDIEYSGADTEHHVFRLAGLLLICDCGDDHVRQTDTCDSLVDTNDSIELTEAEREAKITELFADIGVTVVFIN